jgi:hypothetical protein
VTRLQSGDADVNEAAWVDVTVGPAPPFLAVPSQDCLPDPDAVGPSCCDAGVDKAPWVDVTMGPAPPLLAVHLHDCLSDPDAVGPSCCDAGVNETAWVDVAMGPTPPLLSVPSCNHLPDLDVAGTSIAPGNACSLHSASAVYFPIIDTSSLCVPRAVRPVVRRPP